MTDKYADQPSAEDGRRAAALPAHHRIVDRIPGKLAGKHLQVHADHIIKPRDGVGLFFTTNNNMLGVALQLDDQKLGHVLVQLNAVDVVGLYRLLESVATMDDFTLDRFIEGVGNPGEEN
jgi:hypothetical protein